MTMNLSDLLKSTRQYFWHRHFTEVEIPYLNPSLPLEPNLYSFSTIWMHSQAKYYLPTSPEMALKKYLAGHSQNCFSIGHCFRDLEAEGPWHTKEFLMLEWYEVGKNYLDLMESVKKYLSNFLNLKFEIMHLPDNLPSNEPDFNQYFLNEIETKLPKNKAVFITGYPAFLSPLAAADANSEANKFSARNHVSEAPTREHEKKCVSNRLADRFELYINGIEIANGCTENRNGEQIKAAFLAENQYRLDHHLPTHPYSQDFIDNCAALPPCAGVGLGIDRLLSLLNLC
jgi:elongation factor P--(R)-beta-lysine ligase